MTKKFLPTVEQIELVEHVLDVELIEQAEHILDGVEAVWHRVTKTLRSYSARDGGAVLVHPKSLANFLVENPNAKPVQIARLDRRMLEVVKTILQAIEDVKSGHLDEVARFLVESRNTEKPSKERFEKAAETVARGDLAAYYDDGGRLFLIRDEDVEDFERDHPEAKRITSAEQVQEFVERLQKKLRMA
jgi:hypothetical protein